MRIRTVYFKVSDMNAALKFYSELLGQDAYRTSAVWSEFMLGELRFGLLTTKNGEHPVGNSVGNNCVPVFEFDDDEFQRHIDKIKLMGVKVVSDGLDDPGVESITFADPFGNEFEVSKEHHRRE